MELTKQIKHSIIIKSNHLVDAVYKMNVNTKHLLNILLREITANNKVLDNGQPHIITADDFGKLLNLDKKNQYRELKKAGNELYNMSIKILGKEKYSLYRILEHSTYAVGEGYISLTFARGFMPFIQELQGNYTKLKLAETLRLRRFSSIRIYEKLMQYKSDDNIGWWEVRLDELKELLGIQREHIYWDNKHFNMKIFNPAIKEIKKQLQWNIEVEKIRKGRRLVAVKIIYSDPNNGGLFSVENMSKTNKNKALNNVAKARVLAFKNNARMKYLKEQGIIE